MFILFIKLLWQTLLWGLALSAVFLIFAGLVVVFVVLNMAWIVVLVEDRIDEVAELEEDAQNILRSHDF